jgi:hypothetical protein
MQTYNRICIKDHSVVASNGTLTLSRGKEYLTTAEEEGEVTVFTNFWGKVPVTIFAGEVEFTKGKNLTMKKTEIFLWVSEVAQKLEKLGYKDRQKIAAEDVFQVMQNIFEVGLNVMLYHNDDESTVLFVDTRRFQQR